MSNSDEEENYFPWLVEFTPLLNALIENTNDDLLSHVLTVYEKNVSQDYTTCFHKRYKPVMLKNHIKNTLNFFHFYRRNVKKEISDCYLYLNKMTDILKVYLDLEVRIHKHVDSANILNALCLYLDNSEEHIFKILLQGRYETEELKKIYCPVFAKFLSTFESTKEPIKDFTYIRYLLAFKLWEKMVDDLDDKLKIIDMAQQKLGTSIPQVDSELSMIIPKIPNGHMNATWWLMEHGLINLRKICDDFLEFEKKIHSFLLDKNWKNSQLDVEKSLEEKISPAKKKVKLAVPKLKKNQLLLIDLTSDNDVVEEIITQKQNKQKKQKKRPQWLNEIKMKMTNLKSKCKKSQPVAKRAKSVEVADAHSTENCDSGEKCCANMYQKCDVTVNNSNETNSNLVNTSTIILNDSYCEKSSDSHQDVVDSSTTSVTSVCDNLISSVLTLEPRNTFDLVNEDISSQSDIKLLFSLDDASEKDYISDVLESSSDIGVYSYKILEQEIFDEPIVGEPSNLIFEPQTFERNSLLRGILNYSPSKLFNSDYQRIDPNLLRKKPEEVNDNTDFMENEADISEDLEESFDKEDMNEVSSTTPSIHYGKLRVRRDLKEFKSNILFDLEDLCQSENLVHGFLPFKKRFLNRRIHENGLSLFNKADL